MEPNGDQPERLQVSGVFILGNTSPCGSPSNPCTSSYGEPQRGTIYYSLPTSNVEQTRREWNDLKSVAGKQQVVGFGSGWHPNDVKVLKAGERPSSWAPWTINTGVILLPADSPPAKQLLAFKGQ